MIEVGQKLWCAYNQRYNQNEFAEVVKVGRKWIELSNRRRADKTTLIIDGGQYSSPGKCHISKEAYEEDQERLCRWDEFRKKISSIYHCPDNVTIEKIDRALEVLWM